ncbi:hypothetical protein FIA58_009865 [Flavobacterium jejuense]|uniref:Cytochrome c domain-containing protein n=1 Tax=Flavobacterium jejuense TaxID=1544455 RepID=A0ABX0IQ66_9FLAO|nr:hypothetical protein [Flavobacterium jejuense]NHN25979.1 hypothetical protein [Flavobacterium jejuense]
MKTKQKKGRRNKAMNSITMFAILVTVVLFASCEKKKDKYEKIKEPFELSANIPVDVNPELQERLKKEGDIYQLNEVFNQNSWKTFVAVFWPRDKEGKAKPNFTDEGKATWLGWKEAFQVYRKDGGVPAPWESPREKTGYKNLTASMLEESTVRVYLSSETPTHKIRSKNVADETDQAFAGKLFDQNGNEVYYEVLMNKEEFDYVVKNKLYNINGQIAFSKNGAIANFPAGNYKKDSLGAVEIKFAWKILNDTDHKERYYRNWGYVFDASGNLVKKELGMIGFHISQKTPTGKQWVWSTFEHIDNLDQNVVEKEGKKTIIHPSLTDPECEICPVNVDVTNGGTTFTHNTGVHGDYWTISGDTTDKYFANSEVMKTQAKRMVDIPIRVQQINKKMQAYFKSQKSVFQYYQLIDTQYPLNQNAVPDSHTEEGYKLPGSVTNKSGGEPNIALLTNITMETFFQGGNQSASNLMEANPASDITVFGTESCIGCHSSAGIYNGVSNGQFTTADQLSGDFSWLLSQKAEWDAKIPKSNAYELDTQK